MSRTGTTRAILFLFLGCLVGMSLATTTLAEKKRMKILFIGNSFTARNHLVDVFKKLASAGNPDCEIQETRVLYGGQILEAHWEKYCSGNWVRIAELTEMEQKKKCEELQAAIEKGTDDKRLPGCLRSHQRLLRLLKEKPPKWDYVVLQSYRDTKGGMDSPYAKYARKFAELIRRQGGRVVLYGTAREALNAKPLDKAPDEESVLKEARFFATLAKELDAMVVPVFNGVYCCQKADPTVTLRWVKDGHPNQRCTYLTACMFYAVFFDKSPEGLPVNEVTDTKFRDHDPDGGPNRVVFSDKERQFFQKTAWEAVQEYRKMAKKTVDASR